MFTRGFIFWPILKVKYYCNSLKPQYILRTACGICCYCPGTFLKDSQVHVPCRRLSRALSFHLRQPSPKVSENHDILSVVFTQKRGILNVLGFSVPSTPARGNIELPPQSSQSVASIQSRTMTLLFQLQNSLGDERACHFILKELVIHLQMYPLARSHTLKDNFGIQLLLKIRRRMKSPDIRRNAQIGLTLLGWADNVRGQGLRILAIDGGGTRGVIAIEILKRIEDLCNRQIHDLFDIIVGTSTGAMLAFLIGLKKVSLDEALQLYYRLGEEIFTRNTVVGAGRLFVSHAFYDTENLERILRQEVGGNLRMIDTAGDNPLPKVAAVSTVVNHVVLQPHVFRNYCIHPSRGAGYLGSSKYQLWQALRASSAAPGFFEEMMIGHDIHQDGGLLTNNPCALAVHEARSLWPSTPIQTVVSVGTGMYHGRAGPHTSNFTSVRAKLMKIVASATDTEAVHTVMQDLMPPNTYFRFNPNLSVDVPLDECRREVLDQLQVDARNYIRKFDQKFKAAARSLKKKKTVFDKVKDNASLFWHIHLK